MAKIEVIGEINGQAIASDLRKRLAGGIGAILQDEATQMKIRITRGRDVNEQDFIPYSPKYAERKKKSGRKSSPVDLTFTGKMLASITTKVIPAAGEVVGEVFFSSNAEALKAKGNIDKGRDFFGFSEKQLERVQKKLETLIEG